jgi:hypothetical protein
MKNLFNPLISSFIIFSFVSCSGVEDGACCESAVTMKKDIIYKDPKPIPDPNIKNTGEEDNKTDEPTLLPPVAVISPDVPSIKAEQPFGFNCADSYDQDEQGESIVECIWEFKCYQNDQFKCNCPKKRGTIHDEAVITPPKAKWVDFVEVTLTVVDDENQTNSVTKRFDIVE